MSNIIIKRKNIILKELKLEKKV